MTSVGQALVAAREQGLERLDAQLLLAHVLACPRTWVMAHDDAALAPAVLLRYRQLCALRADAVPLAYLTGEREFHGLVLSVTPAVLVPRPETEHLVDWGLACLAERAGQAAPTMADLGTGSGAVALALAHAVPTARVAAVDVSVEALAVARDNGQRLGLDVDWGLGDWWQPLAGQRFDLVLSNPPYVAEDDPHLAGLRHEPRSALAAGPNGLDALRQIVAGAPAHLDQGAWLLLEHGHDQGAAVREMLVRAGFAAVQTRSDLAGHPRCSGGRWTGQVAIPGNTHAGGP